MPPLPDLGPGGKRFADGDFWRVALGTMSARVFNPRQGHPVASLHTTGHKTKIGSLRKPPLMSIAPHRQIEPEAWHQLRPTSLRRVAR